MTHEEASKSKQALLAKWILGGVPFMHCPHVMAFYRSKLRPGVQPAGDNFYLSYYPREIGIASSTVRSNLFPEAHLGMTWYCRAGGCIVAMCDECKTVTDRRCPEHLSSEA